ncbi:MAG: glycine--tRNA ligase, partial [Phycisphaerales bacterium]
MANKEADRMEKIVALCRRRGFIFGSSEIYGGIGGFWDYGPLGCELKRNIKEAWWNDMVHHPPAGPKGQTFQMVGVDCSIIMNPEVWVASGHVGGFRDPMVSCKAEGCKALFRADQLFHVLLKRNEGDDPFDYCSVEANSRDDAVEHARPKAEKLSKKHGGGSYVAEAMDFLVAAEENLSALKCPRCDTVGSLTEPRAFNLMFESYAGALQESGNKVYLRPETAQGIFVNFKNVIDSTRVRVPFGIAQMGKSFRNEINPRNYTFRSREFEQYEIEFFCHPEEADMWYTFWRDVRHQWYVKHGLKSEKLRLREHEGDELAHYAKSCADVEYDFPF